MVITFASLCQRRRSGGCRTDSRGYGATVGFCECYRRNLGDHLITADVCEMDFAKLPRRGTPSVGPLEVNL